MRYPRRTPALDASARREQILGMGNVVFENLQKLAFVLLLSKIVSDKAVQRVFACDKKQQQNVQNATRSNVNCL